MPPTILPGSTIGILGGGQLGRMFAIAARRMGFRVHTFEPTPDSPAGQVSDVEIAAPYEDIDAVRRFAREVSVISFEFENIPMAALEAAASVCPVRPHGSILHICQNREREKLFLSRNGFPCAAFRVIDSAASLAAGLAEIGVPAVLKTADFGYDGKGQLKIPDATGGADMLWERFGAPRGVLEAWVPFEAEVSVLVARGMDADIRTFPVSENIQTNHILDLSIVPARFPSRVHAAATELAVAIAEKLDLVGLLAVELFLTREGTLIVNELAPRPHNSGHFSFDACMSSQFEQQLRAICGLPLGATDLLTPAVMWNLLGDLWQNGEPNWTRILNHPNAKLHLYGKAEPRPGRKMGHVTFLGDTAETLEACQSLRNREAHHKQALKIG
jgi:5-(carboxyamino)imidazole ribonucleotide synthase